LAYSGQTFQSKFIKRGKLIKIKQADKFTYRLISLKVAKVLTTDLFACFYGLKGFGCLSSILSGSTSDSKAILGSLVLWEDCIFKQFHRILLLRLL
jgi:hypothetical protein